MGRAIDHPAHVPSDAALRRVSAQIRSARIGELFDYWKRKKGDLPMPFVEDIVPDEIPHLMPYLVMFEVERGPERFRLESVGTHIHGMIQRDSTGGYLDEVFKSETLERLHTALHNLVTDRVPGHYRRRVYFAEHLRFLSYEALHLPLTRDGLQVDVAMSGVQFFFDRPSAQRQDAALDACVPAI
ncbi:MAG TPA: PAS domain-containing protein [Pseudomonadales bacterium]|nr:PAS domain-containing protein [Pseudomonadales bacterium]